MKLLTTICAGSLFLAAIAEAEPADHLAQIPAPTQQEKEIISLLQVGKPFIQPNGHITVPLYNPTKYDLTSCVVRVMLPSEKVERIYYSDGTSIRPFKDGAFVVPTSLNNRKSEEMKCDIIKISYKTEKG